VKSLSKTEIEFLDSLKKIGISKSLCESVNGIRRAVFENDTVGTHGVLMSDEDIAEQYSGWWIGSIKMYKDGDVGLEFYYPNADDIDYDSYTYMIIGKHHDGRYYDKNDNWTPESEFKRIVDVVKLAKNVLKPEEDIVFNNKEEFDNWVEENSRKVGDVFESMEDTDYENPLSMYGVPMSERENIKKQTDAFSSWMCRNNKYGILANDYFKGGETHDEVIVELAKEASRDSGMEISFDAAKRVVDSIFGYVSKAMEMKHKEDLTMPRNEAEIRENSDGYLFLESICSICDKAEASAIITVFNAVYPEHAISESTNNIRKEVFEGAGDITCGFDPESAIRDYEDYCDEQSMISECRDEIAKKYFKELCDHIDDLENEACYVWSRFKNAIRDGVQGEELKEIEKEYHRYATEMKVSLNELKDKVNEKIIELNKSNPDEYPLVLIESRLGEMFAPAMKKVKNVALAGALAGNMALAQPSDNAEYDQTADNTDAPAYYEDGWDNMTQDKLNALNREVGAKVTVVGDSPIADISDMGYLERQKKDVDKYKYVDMDELFSNEVGRVSSDHDRDFVMGFGHGESGDIHEAARLAAAAAEKDFHEVMSDEMELINYANAHSSNVDLPLSENDELYDVKYFYDEESQVYHAFVMTVERGYTEWALDHNMESSSSASERMNRISKIR
jgi:hypothetical protein